MSVACQHPSTAHHYDRARGIVTCGICGDVITDQQYELDPAFSRADRGTGAMRQGGGYARPLRSTQLHMPAAPRPSIEVARRGMLGIARQLQIPGDQVEIASGIFKLAVNTNAVGGARTAVLAACLYIVCRRNHSPHTVLDFAECTKQSPYSIVDYMKTICAATNTTIPPIDTSYHLRRFATQLDFGEQTDQVALMALKILRTMRDDWIQDGRRPLGPCAAALVVAANAFGMPRSLDTVAGMVRLTATTVGQRLEEFARTPAAQLKNIDEYEPSNTVDPSAFLKGRQRDDDYAYDNRVRNLAALYYDLVEGAKLSQEATPERCTQWRDFFQGHCEANNLPLPPAERLELANISPQEQLEILGLRHVRPLTQEEIESAATADADLEAAEEEKRKAAEAEKIAKLERPDAGGVTVDEQAQFQQLLHQQAVDDLGDLDFDTPFDEFGEGRGTEGHSVSIAEFGADGGVSTAPATAAELAENNAAAAGGDATIPDSIDEINQVYFSNELGWEEVLLPAMADVSEDADLDEYIIYDNEVREKQWRLNEEWHKDHWKRGAARTLADLKRQRWSRVTGKKRKRGEAALKGLSASESIQAALRSKGAGNLELDNLDMLVGEGGDGEGEGHDDFGDVGGDVGFE